MIEGAHQLVVMTIGSTTIEVNQFPDSLFVQQRLDLGGVLVTHDSNFPRG
jgi:hypothetical protein